MSQFDIAMDALQRVTRLRQGSTAVVEMFEKTLVRQQIHSREELVDLPEITDWHWAADFTPPTAPPTLAHPPRAQAFTDA